MKRRPRVAHWMEWGKDGKVVAVRYRDAEPDQVEAAPPPPMRGALAETQATLL